MSDLVVIAFPTEAKAEEVRQKLLAMQKEYLLELGDAVVAVKDEKGNIKLNQMINTTAAGAVGGAFWGTLIGLIFLMPLAGAALGAASGAVSGALTDLEEAAMTAIIQERMTGAVETPAELGTKYIRGNFKST